VPLSRTLCSMAGRGTASDGLPKLRTQVRFPSPALAQLPRHCAAPLAARHSGSGTWATLGHPRFIETAEELLGGPVIPECPVGVLYFSEAGWHNGDGIGVPGLIFATYFDPLSADSGALRFLPKSHHPEQQAPPAAYHKARAPIDEDADAYWASFPAMSQRPTQATWSPSTCTPGTRVPAGRTVWRGPSSTSAAPDTECERDRTLRSMAVSFEQGSRGFDRIRYPIWRGLGCRCSFEFREKHGS
jgi:hypothetical protein